MAGGLLDETSERGVMFHPFEWISFSLFWLWASGYYYIAYGWWGPKINARHLRKVKQLAFLGYIKSKIHEEIKLKPLHTA